MKHPVNYIIDKNFYSKVIAGLDGTRVIIQILHALNVKQILTAVLEHLAVHNVLKTKSLLRDQLL